MSGETRLSGPEHYRTAQNLLANLRDEMAGSPGALLRTPDQQERMIAEAQAHATLAAVAATIEVAASRGPGDVSNVWMFAVQAKRAAPDDAEGKA
jgi:hypothetical protein